MAGRKTKAAVDSQDAAIDRSFLKLIEIIGGHMNRLEDWVRDGGEETFTNETQGMVYDSIGRCEQLLTDLARMRARG